MKLYTIGKKLFSYMKVFFFVVTIIVFWLTLIGASPLINGQKYPIQIINTTAENRLLPILAEKPKTENITNIVETPIISYFDNRSHKTFPPREKSIILRMDIEEYAMKDLVINLTDTILNMNMSVTLVVPPDRNLHNDFNIRKYLIDKSKNPRIEIAQYGYDDNVTDSVTNITENNNNTNNTENVTDGVITKITENNIENNNTNNTESVTDEKDVYKMIELGKKEIINDLRIVPVTFVLPYDEYDRYLIEVLTRLNFKIISAKVNDLNFDAETDTNFTYENEDDNTIEISGATWEDGPTETILSNLNTTNSTNDDPINIINSTDIQLVGNVASIGYNVRTSAQDQLIPIRNVLKNCKVSLDERNICVILIHPQDYSMEDEWAIDDIKHAEFVSLLDELKKLNAKSITFKDLIKYN